MNKAIATGLIAGSLALGAAGGVAIDNNDVIIIAPELDTQQQYIANEVANNRIPQLDASKVPVGEIEKAATDYLVVANYLGDDISQLVNYCILNRGADDCDLYVRVKNQIELQVNELNP